jgi:hypothetical protein
MNQLSSDSSAFGAAFSQISQSNNPGGPISMSQMGNTQFMHPSFSDGMEMYDSPKYNGRRFYQQPLLGSPILGPPIVGPPIMGAPMVGPPIYNPYNNYNNNYNYDPYHPYTIY